MNTSDDETIQRLDKTIRKLIECIKKYPNDLNRHEHATRYALVDPMLRALGWDVSDPAWIVPEYRIASFGNTKQYADYALFAKRRKTSSLVVPSLILEAKKYNTTQQEMGKARRDAREGAAETKAQYFAFTDGNHWALYKYSSSEEITSFKLRDPDGSRIAISTLCQKALPLAKSRLGRPPQKHTTRYISATANFTIQRSEARLLPTTTRPTVAIHAMDSTTESSQNFLELN